MTIFGLILSKHEFGGQILVKNTQHKISWKCV